jgi:hypothetical protein
MGEFNVCDYAFKASDFGLNSVCWRGQFNNDAAKKFGAMYKEKFGIENQYPFFDQATYDSILIDAVKDEIPQIKDIISKFKYPTKVKIGNNYNELT